MTLRRDDLVGLGFKSTTYPGQDGEFLTFTTKVEDMPYAKEHMVDGEYIFGDSRATVELTPLDAVQFCILDADYSESYALESDEGQALLLDAIGKTAPANMPTPPSPRA